MFVHGLVNKCCAILGVVNNCCAKVMALRTDHSTDHAVNRSFVNLKRIWRNDRSLLDRLVLVIVAVLACGEGYSRWNTSQKRAAAKSNPSARTDRSRKVTTAKSIIKSHPTTEFAETQTGSLVVQQTVPSPINISTSSAPIASSVEPNRKDVKTVGPVVSESPSQEALIATALKSAPVQRRQAAVVGQAWRKKLRSVRELVVRRAKTKTGNGPSRLGSRPKVHTASAPHGIIETPKQAAVNDLVALQPTKSLAELKPKIVGHEEIKNVRVRLRARRKVWAQLFADGKPIFSDGMNQGELRIVEGSEAVRILVGDASAIDVEWNGKSIGPIGTAGMIAAAEFRPVDYSTNWAVPQKVKSN